MQISRDPEH